MSRRKRNRFLCHCGPLQVAVASHSAVLLAKAQEILALYSVVWPAVDGRVSITLYDERRRPEALAGSYLRTGRMQVDHRPGGLAATYETGTTATYEAGAKSWQLFVPAPEGRELNDCQHLLELALTIGWRQLSWVPLHAGGATFGPAGALLCAPAGGGKSTLTTALLSRGWGSLGDDKLLLGTADDGHPCLASLLHTFTLHPRTARWFPELGPLEQFPAESEWAQKRRVDVSQVWPQNGRFQARLTHLVIIDRRPAGTGFELQALDSAAILPLLLQQTVLPNDAAEGRQILATAASAAGQMQGWRLAIGEDAYSQPEGLALLEQALV